MSELSDYKRLVSGPLEAELRAEITRLRSDLSTALARNAEIEGESIQVGWAYRDRRWDTDRWHVCGWEKPREHDGREVRPIFISAAAIRSSTQQEKADV